MSGYSKWLALAAALAIGVDAHAQQSVLGRNLIVNGDAEAGPSAKDLKAPVSSIPGWTPTGKPSVLSYNATGFLQLTDPTPPDHGFQYFAAQSASTLTQKIDVSAGSAAISGGNVKFTASAYLGSIGVVSFPPQMSVAFQNAGGQTFNTVTLGPVGAPTGAGVFLQQQIGLVPSGTALITVTVTFTSTASPSSVDSLSLVLTQLSTTPTLGTNLVVNPGAEAGAAAPLPDTASNIPGWSTAARSASVAPYGGSGWISATSPGPPDRGVNLFCGWVNSADLYQDIDVSGSASLIDSGQVTYQVSGWFGGVGVQYANLTYVFYDWSGKQLQPTAQVTATRSGTALIEAGQTGTVPPGSRRVRLSLVFPASFSIADDIAFTLASPNAPPVISPGGIFSASAFGQPGSIAPGSWIEIYGTNLASSTQVWGNSDFQNGVGPTSLGGVTVSVGGRPAFIDYVSPTQVNALVPSDAPVGSGTADIVVTNGNGRSDPFGVYVSSTAPGLLAPPSFQLNGKQYVAALFSDGQTFVLPQGAISGVASRPAKPGETVTLFGVGFGPVTGGFTAGTIVNGQNQLTTNVQFLFGSTPAVLSYDGLAPSFTGLYQFNVVVPKVGPNDAMALSINLGGAAGMQKLYIAVGQ